MASDNELLRPPRFYLLGPVCQFIVLERRLLLRSLEGVYPSFFLLARILKIRPPETHWAWLSPDICCIWFTTPWALALIPHHRRSFFL